MSWVKNIFFAVIIFSCCTCIKNVESFDGTLRAAKQNHNFKAVAQLKTAAQPTLEEKKKIKKTNIAIQRYFLKKINAAKSLNQLNNLHKEILEKIDFFENTQEYTVLSTMLYDKAYEISK